MEQEKLKAYAARVSQANRSELVVIMYEVMIESIQNAKVAFAEGWIEDALAEVKRAQGMLTEMKGSLDFQYALSGQLYTLYKYVYEQLVATVVKRQPIELDCCERVLTGLCTSFTEIAKQDHSQPLMEHTQQVYAGLTYGKGSLNEVMIQEDEQNRGFRV